MKELLPKDAVCYCIGAWIRYVGNGKWEYVNSEDTIYYNGYEVESEDTNPCIDRETA